MFSAFKGRKPWAAAAVTFIFDPVLGMLYLNRGYLALLYLALEYAAAVAALAMFPSLIARGMILVLYASLPFRLIGAVHAYFLARSRPYDEAMHWYSRWYAVALIYLAFPAAALVIRTFLFQPFNLPAHSMSPTLNVGDYVWVKKFAYIGSAPQRGDLIVFRTAQGDAYVKRIAGLPGDRIQLVAGRLFVNGIAVKLERIADFQPDCDFAPCPNAAQYIETLPGGGEHHILQMSTDGPLDNIPPVTVPPGAYYVLGDNRDNSNDSRLNLGFIPAQNIVGQVAVKFIDGRLHRMVWQAVD